MTKTPPQNELELKITRSRIVGLSTWAICELTNAGGKKSMIAFRLPPWTCTSTALGSERSLRTETKLLFRALWENIRFSTASLSSWDRTLISLGLKNTGLITAKSQNSVRYPIFILSTWSLFSRTNFRTFEGLKTNDFEIGGHQSQKMSYSTVILKILLS